MATVDTFLADLRGYIQHQDEQPLLGPNFYRSHAGRGTVSPATEKKWALNLFYVTGQHIRAFGGIFMNTGLGPLDQKIPGHIVENLRKAGIGWLWAWMPASESIWVDWERSIKRRDRSCMT